MRYTNTTMYKGFNIKLKIEENKNDKPFIDDFVIRVKMVKPGTKLTHNVITETELVEIPYWVYAYDAQTQKIEFTRINAEIYDMVSEYVDNLTEEEFMDGCEEIEDN